MEQIIASIVEESKRLSTLPYFFPHSYMLIENNVFDMAANLSDYDGGYWEFVTLSNGGFFLYPRGEKIYRVVNNMNYADVNMDEESFGLTCTIIVMSLVSFHLYEKDKNHPDLPFIIKNLDYLKDYAEQLKFSSEIFQVID